jgi:hypothetical protein
MRIIAEYVVIDNPNSSSLLRISRLFSERNYIKDGTHSELKFLIKYRNNLMHLPNHHQLDSLSDSERSEILIRLNLVIEEMDSLYSLL